MTAYQITVLIFAGLMAGFVGGTLSVGGGIIIVPVLVYILGLTQHQAQGTSLAVLLFPIGILAVINYAKNGYVNYKFALVLILTFVIGSYFGSVFSIHMPEKVLKKIFGGLMLIAGMRMIIFS
ncbi:MAG: sulfite exporter TauE/SafE family protein [Bacteroidales bacterium]|nr:sulfite exporter TauE/SafE family protein [Bacteroidales bacterium]